MQNNAWLKLAVFAFAGLLVVVALGQFIAPKAGAMNYNQHNPGINAGYGAGANIQTPMGGGQVNGQGQFQGNGYGMMNNGWGSNGIPMNNNSQEMQMPQGNYYPQQSPMQNNMGGMSGSMQGNMQQQPGSMGMMDNNMMMGNDKMGMIGMGMM